MREKILMKEDQGVASLLCCLVNSLCVMRHESVINKNSLREGIQNIWRFFPFQFYHVIVMLESACDAN